MKAAQEASARAKVQADWAAQVRGKVKSKIFLPPDVKGNPEAVFEVNLLPSGEVLNARLKKSSGHAALDVNIERAILGASPLPKPVSGEVPRNLELRFRPLDD
jgi:colicin import membrane protein